eukprot:GHVU01010318.1.p3 GENE.GHVU01010318.1~~GHVU01010318.1.p3  ORF type:complete len:132 (+),score=0.92 GHVU01010318.1:440-835(+)
MCGCGCGRRCVRVRAGIGSVFFFVVCLLLSLSRGGEWSAPVRLPPMGGLVGVGGAWVEADPIRSDRTLLVAPTNHQRPTGTSSYVLLRRPSKSLLARASQSPALPRVRARVCERQAWQFGSRGPSIGSATD